jgi:imidazolonepropionase
MIPADLIVRGADLLVTCAGPVPRRGVDQGKLPAIPNGSLASREGRIVFVGSTHECDREVTPTPDARIIDASGSAVLPGFVDPHTHAVYAGDRWHELQQRLSGASYAEIAAAGGGIVSTVRATRAAPAEQIAAQTCARLDDMLRCGTTTCEVKSGYGLDTASELKLLRVVRDLNRTHPIDLVPTFLGAHGIPPEYRDSEGRYVDIVINEMLPAVAAEGLAAWCDVFCERGVFGVEASTKILEAGRAHGLAPRIHADELGPSGGSLVAARVGARSADHLVFIDATGMSALARAAVVATLLPCAAFFLKLGRFAPARELIAAGVPVALATDVNPGGGFAPSMATAMAIACFAMNMTLEEAVAAATINAAYSLDVHRRAGSLETDKDADVVVLRGGLTELLRLGTNPVKVVIKRGSVITC